MEKQKSIVNMYTKKKVYGRIELAEMAKKQIERQTIEDMQPFYFLMLEKAARRSLNFGDYMTEMLIQAFAEEIVNFKETEEQIKELMEYKEKIVFVKE